MKGNIRESNIEVDLGLRESRHTLRVKASTIFLSNSISYPKIGCSREFGLPKSGQHVVAALPETLLLISACRA
jgi:hypothetical protein